MRKTLSRTIATRIALPGAAAGPGSVPSNTAMHTAGSFLGPTAALVAAVATLSTAGLRAGSPIPTGKLAEVIQVLRTHLELGSTEFEARAAQALIERFGVRPVDPADAASKAAPGDPVARREHLDGGILYLRIGRVEVGLAQALRTALAEATLPQGSRGEVSGLVLDLRFARGESLQAAGEAVALFSDRTEAVLEWGGGSVTGSGAQRAWGLPMAVLVNGRTEGAAEALATALRQETGSALVGQATAGTHGVFREVTLQDGTRLQVPVGRIRLGDGSTLAPGPITPDIRIAVPEASERGFVENPVATLGAGGPRASAGISDPTPDGRTNAQAQGTSPLQRRKVTEADLIRAQRSDPSEGTNEAPAAVKPPAPVRLADPVLARAADLVRGLSAFQKGR